MNSGIIQQIIGPVVDVYFEDTVPSVQTALKVVGEDRTVVLEVSQHVGLKRVRCIAMSDTAGLTRGMKVEDTGAPISSRWTERVRLMPQFPVVLSTRAPHRSRNREQRRRYLKPASRQLIS